MRPRSRHLRRLAGLTLALVLAAACSGNGDEEALDREPPRSSTTTSTTAAPAPTLPLLGTTGEPPQRPALVVKIDNAPLGRPQAGINQADLVVVEAVEGGITRLFAVYHSAEAAEVGPVRSARSTDIVLATPLRAPLFAWSGANAAFVELVRSSPLVDVGIDAFPGAYRRVRGRPAPYNLFSSTETLRQRTPDGAQTPVPWFDYREEGAEPPTGDEIAGVRITYPGRVPTGVEWRWDGDRRAWVRSQNGTDHVDAAGERVAPVNVVVQFTPYVDTGFVDQSGEPVPEAELVGEGQAWVLTAGRLVEARWSRPTPDAVTRYTSADGKPVRLTPGRTWIELARPDTASRL